MKKIVWAICTFAFILIACSAKQNREEPEEEPQVLVTQPVVQPDTLTNEEVEDALPVRADEVFDDFLFNYTSDSTAQMRRTSFPLPYYRNGEKTELKRSDWTFDPLFSNMEYFSVIYNKPSDMALEKDTALDHVQMEYLYLERQEAKRYYFYRNPKGYWILYKIMEEAFDSSRDPIAFLEFYHHFATDEAFQQKHVAENLKFITFDPDDEFKTVECDISVGQWFAYKPELLTDFLTQVNYGQNASGDTDKIVNLRGQTNGFNNTLIFTHRENTWYLTSFEDTSE